METDLTIFNAWLYFVHLTDENHRYTSPMSSPTGNSIKLFREPSYVPKPILLPDLKFKTPSEFGMPLKLEAILPTSETVFVKALDVVNDEFALGQFQTEVEAYRRLEQLQRKVIPGFHGCFSTEEMIYWIMLEPCGRRLDKNEACRRADEIKKAFADIHAFGVCHGDVSPRNILIDEHGRVRIVDFGLAAFEPIQDAEADRIAEWRALLQHEDAEIGRLLGCNRI